MRWEGKGSDGRRRKTGGREQGRGVLLTKCLRVPRTHWNHESDGNGAPVARGGHRDLSTGCPITKGKLQHTANGALQCGQRVERVPRPHRLHGVDDPREGGGGHVRSQHHHPTGSAGGQPISQLPSNLHLSHGAARTHGHTHIIARATAMRRVGACCCPHMYTSVCIS